MKLERLLFVSCHGYLDPSSGAMLATRDILELLTARGTDCRVLSTGVLDFECETTLESVLDPLAVPYKKVDAVLAGQGITEVVDLTLNGVRVTLLPTTSSRAERAPNAEESGALLNLFDQVLHRFRPEIILTFGGHPVNLAMMARARQVGVPVVFHLHNFAYDDHRAFVDANAVLVPSDYTQRYYARRIGVATTSIPYPVRSDRIVADHHEPKYLTFVNPQPAKGASVFARIAVELDRRRPDIPLLIVEGRGQALALSNTKLDLSGLSNIHRMANTPDPRQFYGVSRAVVVPSLWKETFGRVAAEALTNGLPVLASDRGALPSTLGDAGFVFTLPERCTPLVWEVPTAREIAPWIAVIERIWDDVEFETSHRERAFEAAKQWNSSSVIDLYEKFFVEKIHSLNSI